MKLQPQFAIQNPSHLLKILTTVLVASMIFIGPVPAAKVHIPGNKVAFLDVGVELEAFLKLAGLGEGDITVFIEAEATVGITVQNPGENEPPGQQVGVIATGSAIIPSDQIKNGTVTLVVSTEPVEEEDVEVELPNPQWDFDINDVTFELATITVVQNGVVVFQDTFEP